MPKVEYYRYTLPVLHDKIIFASIKVSHMSGVIIMYCILLLQHMQSINDTVHVQGIVEFPCDTGNHGNRITPSMVTAMPESVTIMAKNFD